MNAALDSPIQALAQLGRRINPYSGWAKTFSRSGKPKDTEEKKKQRGLASYYEARFTAVGSALAKCEIPKSFSDPERAQVYLGYLAKNEKLAKSEGSGNQNGTTANKEESE